LQGLSDDQLINKIAKQMEKILD